VELVDVHADILDSGHNSKAVGAGHAGADQDARVVDEAQLEALQLSSVSSTDRCNLVGRRWTAGIARHRQYTQKDKDVW